MKVLKKMLSHRIFFIFLLLFAALFVPSNVQAKKVKIQTAKQIIAKTYKAGDRDAGKFIKKIVKRAEKGKVAYVGTAKQAYKIEAKIRKYYKEDLVIVSILYGGENDIDYNEYADCPYRGVSRKKILSLKNNPDKDLYYVQLYEKWPVNGESTYGRCRSRRYWRMAKRAVRKAGVKNGMSDRVAVRKITDWICRHTRYKIVKQWNCKTGILFKRGVGQCEDYADAFWAMCQVCGIPAKKVDSKTHVWNRVKVGGKWYWIDTTWIDTGKTQKYYLSRKLWRDHGKREMGSFSVDVSSIY